MRMLIAQNSSNADYLQRATSRAGFMVDCFSDLEDCQAAMRCDAYDVVLLDLDMPNMDALALVRALRKRRDHTPVIGITSQSEAARKVECLDAGLNDCLAKPFDLGELLARLRVQIRRKDGRSSDFIHIRDVRIDLSAHHVARGETAVDLTSREYRVLIGLARRQGKLVSKAELESHLYTETKGVESNTVEVAICALRRKLGHDLIRTARGLGYVISSLGAGETSAAQLQT